MNLQKRLMLATLPVIIVLTSVILGVFTLITTRTLEDQIQENNKLLCSSYAAQLDARLVQIVKMAKDLASAVVTSINVETTLQDAAKRYTEFSYFFYTVSSGEVRDMSPYNGRFMNFDFSSYSAWNEVLRTGNTIISDPQDFQGSASIFFFSPVILDYLAEGDSKTVGVIILVLPADHLFQPFRHVKIGTSGAPFILNGDGFFIEHVNPSYTAGRTFLDIPSETSLDGIYHYMISEDNYSGFATYYSGGDRKFLSFAPVPASGWVFALEGTYREFTRPIANAALLSLVLLIIGIGLTVLLLFFIVRVAAKPIVRLTAAVRAIDQGNMELTVEEHSSGEVGVLSAAINHMVARIKNNQLVLEEKVKERTADLARSMEQLQKTQNQLIQAEKMNVLGQLSAGLAHELNTPFGAISSANRTLACILREISGDLFFLLASAEKTVCQSFFRILEKCPANIGGTEDLELNWEKRKKIESALSSYPNGEELSEYLLELHIDPEETDTRVLLGHHDNLIIFKGLYNIINAERMSSIIDTAAFQGAKVISALRSYLNPGRSDEGGKVDIPESIRTVITLLQNEIKQGINIVLDLGSGTVFGSTEQLHQVWINLVRNAMQAMEYRGEIKIISRTEKGSVTVTIIDYGPGIKETIKDKIFEPFFSTKNHAEGLGLGLDICRKIVLAHQGSIAFTSSPGKTEFSVILPEYTE